MKSYTATEESMQEYSRIVSALTQLDMQRQEYMQQLSQWEQAHAVPEEQAHAIEADPAPSEEVSLEETQ